MARAYEISLFARMAWQLSDILSKAPVGHKIWLLTFSQLMKTSHVAQHFSLKGCERADRHMLQQRLELSNLLGAALRVDHLQKDYRARANELQEFCTGFRKQGFSPLEEPERGDGHLSSAHSLTGSCYTLKITWNSRWLGSFSTTNTRSQLGVPTSTGHGTEDTGNRTRSMVIMPPSTGPDPTER